MFVSLLRGINDITIECFGTNYDWYRYGFVCFTDGLICSMRNPLRLPHYTGMSGNTVNLTENVHIQLGVWRKYIH